MAIVSGCRGKQLTRLEGPSPPCRCKLASGSLWDEKGFLPRGYKPLNPLQFLGEYIMGKLKVRPP